MEPYEAGYEITWRRPAIQESESKKPGAYRDIRPTTVSRSRPFNHPLECLCCEQVSRHGPYESILPTQCEETIGRSQKHPRHIQIGGNRRGQQHWLMPASMVFFSWLQRTQLIISETVHQPRHPKYPDQDRAVASSTSSSEEVGRRRTCVPYNYSPITLTLNS